VSTGAHPELHRVHWLQRWFLRLLAALVTPLASSSASSSASTELGSDDGVTRKKVITHAHRDAHEERARGVRDSSGDEEPR
jgi:hypothetical protein